MTESGNPPPVFGGIFLCKAAELRGTIAEKLTGAKRPPYFAPRHDEACSLLVVLGVAPGLQRLAYCAVTYGDQGTLPEAGIRQLLKVIRMNGAASPLEFQKKFVPHAKILDVVLERALPVVVAVGPPASSSEPLLQVETARFCLRLLVQELARQGLPVRHFEWRTKDELVEELGLAGWNQVLLGRLKNASRIKKPALQLAAATALAGGSAFFAEKKAASAAT